MIEKVILKFSFKGNRKYIHGTDIFTSLTRYFNDDLNNIDIVFHSITVKNMTFYSIKPLENKIKVTFKATTNKNKIKLFGIENKSNANSRYEYDENKIINNSTINIPDSTIILNKPTKYSFIEHIVAMNKSLLENLYTACTGKWYFTRLQLKENININNVTALSLTLESNFQFKITKTAIINNNIKIGFIYFSLIQQDF